MPIDRRKIIIGQRCYSGFHWAGRGMVVRIHGEQSPASVGNMGGGIVTYGGGAHFDVIYDNGVESKMIPESVLRNDRLLDEIATADEVIDAVANSARHKAEKDAEATATVERRVAERAKHKADNPHLKEGGRAAENIRLELKRRFPGVKFSVRSDHNSVNVSWVDGPTQDAVQAVTRRHKEGHFDGMTDMYETDLDATFADVFGGAQYINEDRGYGDRENVLAAQLCEAYKVAWNPARSWESLIHGDNAPTLVRRILANVDLTGRGPVRLVRTDVDAGRIDDFWTVEDAPEVTPDPSLQYPDPAPVTGPMVCERKGRWLLAHEDDGEYPYSYGSRAQAEKRLAKLGDGWAIWQPGRFCYIVRDDEAKAAPVVSVASVVSGPDDPAVVAFLTTWHEAGRAEFERNCPSLNYDEHCPKVAKDGPRWIKLDRSGSGVFVCDKTTGKVYGIKAYGVPNLGKLLGTLAELAASFAPVEPKPEPQPAPDPLVESMAWL